MDKQELLVQISQIIQEYLKNEAVELFDLIYRHQCRDLYLRILVDKPEGGITLDECAHLNNGISRLLDEKNIIQERYVLEVFSPGLDRPLIKQKDFLRCLNKSVRFFLKEPLNGKRELTGIIKNADEQAVDIEIEGELARIPLLQIAKARQIIE